MTTTRGAGRPRAASRALLEEAACELFLEQGFAATSVADVTARAGVSRSTFFNYFDTKADLLWSRFDDAVARLRADLEDSAGDADAVLTALRGLAAHLPADNVALAFSQERAMGLGQEQHQAAARRLTDVRDVLAAALRPGRTDLAAESVGGAWAAALLAAVRAWALAGAGAHALLDVLDEALAAQSA